MTTNIPAVVMVVKHRVKAHGGPLAKGELETVENRTLISEGLSILTTIVDSTFTQT